MLFPNEPLLNILYMTLTFVEQSKPGEKKKEEEYQGGGETFFIITGR